MVIDRFFTIPYLTKFGYLSFEKSVSVVYPRFSGWRVYHYGCWVHFYIGDIQNLGFIIIEQFQFFLNK